MNDYSFIKMHRIESKTIVSSQSEPAPAPPFYYRNRCTSSTTEQNLLTPKCIVRHQPSAAIVYCSTIERRGTGTTDRLTCELVHHFGVVGAAASPSHFLCTRRRSIVWSLGSESECNGCLVSVQISCNNEMMMQLSAVMHGMHHVPDSLAAKNNTTQHTDTAFTSSQCQDRSAIIVLHSLDRRVGRFNQEMEMEEKERID